MPDARGVVGVSPSRALSFAWVSTHGGVVQVQIWALAGGRRLKRRRLPRTPGKAYSRRKLCAIHADHCAGACDPPLCLRWMIPAVGGASRRNSARQHMSWNHHGPFLEACQEKSHSLGTPGRAYGPLVFKKTPSLHSQLISICHKLNNSCCPQMGSRISTILPGPGWSLTRLSEIHRGHPSPFSISKVWRLCQEQRDLLVAFGPDD